MKSPDLTPLESEALKQLLAGEDPVLAGLRKQLAVADIRSREFTGVGFYVNFDLPKHVPRLHEVLRVKPEFWLTGVKATVDSLEHGVGFLLHVKDGLLDFLEGYTYGESWPQNIRSFEVQYIKGERRDLNELRRQWELSD
jgi:hypothetical protein